VVLEKLSEEELNQLTGRKQVWKNRIRFLRGSGMFIRYQVEDSCGVHPAHIEYRGERRAFSEADKFTFI
jgi:hypothetical protein